MKTDRTGLFSFVTFTWVGKLIWKAYKEGLSDENLPSCSKFDACNLNTDR